MATWQDKDMIHLARSGTNNAANLLFDEALRGRELMNQVETLLFQEFEIIASCVRGVWYAVDRAKGEHYGDCIYPSDPATHHVDDHDHFESLHELYLWCVKNRTEVTRDEKAE